MYCIVCCIVYPPFTRKRNIAIYFGRDVCTSLGVTIFQVSGPLVFHIKVGASCSELCPWTQQANFLACPPPPPLNAERQARKL